MQYKPFRHQIIATNHAIANKKCGLFLEMGLGKTVSTLTLIDLLIYHYHQYYKVLVVAPKKVAEDTWTVEQNKWDHLNNLRVVKVLGTPAQREKALQQDADIYVTNYGNLRWLIKKYGYKMPFNFLVLDELSKFKSSSSKRFKELCKLTPFFDRIIGLTGTPRPNGIEDLWSQIFLLDQGERLERTISDFRRMYLTPDTKGKSPYGNLITYSYRPIPGAKERVYAKIADICISMEAKDWIELPPLINQDHRVYMTSKERKLYKELEKELILELEDADIVAGSAAVLTQKLLQLGNGALYDADRNVHRIHNQKIEALADIVEQTNNAPLLVFYGFKFDRDAIMETFPQAVEHTGPETTKAWNDGRIEMLVCHPASAGHGLNLQYGGNHLVWYGLTWSLELYQQGVARLLRTGQGQTVINHRIITHESKDLDVLAALDSKAEDQTEFMQRIKANILGG